MWSKQHYFLAIVFFNIISFVLAIIGGENIAINKVPHQVSLQTLPGRHFCGGVIIDHQWILTAGHCVLGWPAHMIRIATGSSYHSSPAAVYYVNSIYFHCNYHNPAYNNDLALLHLNTSINYNENTQSIDLAMEKPKENEELIFTGWGLTDKTASDHSEQLQKLILNNVNRAKCSEMLKDFDDVSINVSLLCGFSKINEGICHGDTGGALVGNGKLHGVAIWGYPCAEGVPDLYANVNYYRDWMRQVMSGNSKCKSVV